MYAIKNKRTGAWWIGTRHDYRRTTQITSNDRAVLFEDWQVDADPAFEVTPIDAFMLKRHMSPDYVPVRVELTELKEG